MGVSSFLGSQVTTKESERGFLSLFWVLRKSNKSRILRGGKGFVSSIS